MTNLKGYIIAAGITAVAGIIAAFISVSHHYLLKGEDESKVVVEQVQVPLLEKQLAAVNIYLSDAEVEKVRGFLRKDAAYQALADDCLALLKGKQLVSPVPLDTINGWYKEELGLKGDPYIAKDRYDNMGKLRWAIYKAWLEKQPPGTKEKGFREIVTH